MRRVKIGFGDTNFDIHFDIFSDMHAACILSFLPDGKKINVIVK